MTTFQNDALLASEIRVILAGPKVLAAIPDDRSSLAKAAASLADDDQSAVAMIAMKPATIVASTPASSIASSAPEPHRAAQDGNSDCE